MAAWIGSTDGASDIGILRIRKSPTATHVYFDVVSNVRFADDLYLTVVDDFPLKSIPMGFTDANVPYAYLDTAYTNQNLNFKPIVIMGGESVVKLVGGAGSLIKNASDSWVPDGTITDYLWACPTAASITNSTTSQATFNFNTTGVHLISCRVTSNLGVQNTRYQKVFVWDDTEPFFDIRLDVPPFGFLSSGGFECTVTALSPLGFIPKDQQAVILFAHKEYYGSTSVSLGQCVGSEPVYLNGHVVGSSIQTDKATGQITFTIRGKQGLLQEKNCQGIQITSTQVNPTRWDELKLPTLKHLYWHFIAVRSSISDVMDCYPPTSTLIYPTQDATRGTLWDQLSYLADKIFARLGVDPYGRLFCEVPYEMESDAAKAAATALMTVTQQDRVSVTRDVQPQGLVSCIYGASVSIVDATSEPTSYYSVAPGKMELDEGQPRTVEYLSASQSDSNAQVGRLLTDLNNREIFTVELAMNNRLLTLFPAQLVSLELDASENPLEVDYTGKLSLEALRSSYDELSGSFSWEISGRFLQNEGLSANGVIPVADTVGGADEYELPDMPDDFEGLPSLPTLPSLPSLPPLPAFPNDDSFLEAEFIMYDDEGSDKIWYTKQADQIDPDWFRAITPYSAPYLIDKIVITPDGHIYMGNNQSIMWATTEDTTFVEMINLTWLKAQYPGGLVSTDKFISALFANPEADNEIFLIIGAGYLGGQYGHVWRGNNSGLTQKVALPGGFYPGNNGPIGHFSPSTKGWVATYGAGVSSLSARIRFNKGLTSAVDAIGFGFSGGASKHRAGGGIMVGWHQGTSNQLRISTDEGQNWTAAPFTHNTTLGIAPTQADVSVSGKIMCVVSATGTQVKKSSDLGVSFSDVTLPVNFIPNEVFCLSDDNWIMLGRDSSSPFLPYVYKTDDFGVSWFPVYGNLPIVNPVNSGQASRLVAK